MAMGWYSPSASRSPARLVPWKLPVSSNLQYPLIPDAAYLAGLSSTSTAPVGPSGRYFHDQVGRLPLPGYYVAVVLSKERRVGVEGNQYVRVDALACRSVRLGDGVPPSGHDGGVRIAEVLGEVVQVSVLAEVLNAGHVVWLSFRRVRLLQEGLRSYGHIRPFGAGGSGWLIRPW